MSIWSSHPGGFTVPAMGQYGPDDPHPDHGPILLDVATSGMSDVIRLGYQSDPWAVPFEVDLDIYLTPENAERYARLILAAVEHHWTRQSNVPPVPSDVTCEDA